MNIIHREIMMVGELKLLHTLYLHASDLGYIFGNLWNKC